MKAILFILAFTPTLALAHHGYILKIFGTGVTATTSIHQMETREGNFKLCRDLRRALLEEPMWEYVLCTPET